MPKLIVNAFLTLDGVMQAPGGPDEERSSGFPHGGWQFPYADEAMGRLVKGGTYLRLTRAGKPEYGTMGSA